MKKFIFLILILALLGGGYYYYNQNSNEVSTTSYEYINIEKGNIKKIVSATGKIIPTSTLILSSEISGKIVDVEKDYNEIITQGDVLATFDQNPFLLSVKETETSVSISKSKLKQKMASLEKAKSELNNSISNKMTFAGYCPEEGKINPLKATTQIFDYAVNNGLSAYCDDLIVDIKKQNGNLSALVPLITFHP